MNNAYPEPTRTSRPQTAIVTGAMGGIGKTTVQKLLDSGQRVWATDLNAPDFDCPKATCRSVDVTDEDAWSTLIEEVELDGGFDQLFLCHGISQPHVSTVELSLEGWQKVQDVNLTSCFLGIRAALPPLSNRGWGRIVTVASIAAKEASAGEHTYAASKAGLVALVKSVGKEVAQTGVTINAVAPGPVETELWQVLSDDLRQDRLRRTPMGRPARPDEIVSLMLWLSSDEASYVTAQCFDSSGGRAVY
jgi:NAD(P)-dependent dehydrogenase (short-subunit alcohol dehydrogenase family)